MTTKEQVDEAKFLYKRQTKVKHYRPIVANDVLSVVGVDLADYTGNEEGSNRGYIVCMIDYFSRYAYTEVIQHKSKTELDGVLDRFIKRFGVPDNIHSDRESALINSNVVKKYNINVYHTDNLNAHTSGGSAICERFIKTLRSKLEQYRDQSVARSWKQHVEECTKQYNEEDVHRTIKMTPYDAMHDMKKLRGDAQKDDLIERDAEVKADEKKHKPKIKVGDKVLIPLEQGKFSKGYKRKWSKEVYEVVKVNDTTPTTYTLSNGITNAYAENLQVITKEQENYLKKPKVNKKVEKVEINNKNDENNENNENININKSNKTNKKPMSDEELVQIAISYKSRLRSGKK
jgi:predicted nucleic acid-binding protein